MPLDEDLTRYTAPPKPLGNPDADVGVPHFRNTDEEFFQAPYLFGKQDRAEGVARRECPFFTEHNSNAWLHGWDEADKELTK